MTDILEHSLHIDAPPETVWALWTDPTQLCAWWGVEADADPTPGGIFRVVMESGPVMRGEYVELEPPNRLLFTFGWEGGAPGGPLPPGSSRVEVTLEEAAGGTQLTLRHHDLPPEHVADHERGWVSFLQVMAEHCRSSS